MVETCFNLLLIFFMFYFLLDQKVNKKPGFDCALNLIHFIRFDFGFRDMEIFIKRKNQASALIPLGKLQVAFCDRLI